MIIALLISFLVPICKVEEDYYSKHTNSLGIFSNSSHLRVIEGHYAKLGDFPYQISFKTRSEGGSLLFYNFCGGALLSENKVVSTAHCFDDEPKTMCEKFLNKRSVADLSQYWAHAGTLWTMAVPHKKDNQENGQWRRLSNCQFHNDYNYPDYDIAVLTVSYPFSINYMVGPIPYASAYIGYYGMKCVATGYGLENTGKNARLTMILQYTELRVMSNIECAKSQRQAKHIRDYICTWSRGEDVAEGDSGGPLVCMSTGDSSDKGHGVLVGLATGKSDKYGTIFTRVSSHKDFVNRAIDFSASSATNNDNVMILVLVLIVRIK